MQHDSHALARLDHLIEMAESTFAHGARQGAIDPDGFATLQQIAANQVGSGQVAAIWATNRVLPQPVGPFSSTGKRLS